MKIKNTSAIPLRAAYLHGPYTLYTACYPSTFDPNHKADGPFQDGCPEFEPNLKAGGSWTSRLTVPENIRETAGKANVKRRTDGSTPNFSWIIEISSQVIFSTSAAVHFELLVGRDEKSVELGFSSLTGQTVATPGQLQDHQQSRRSRAGHSNAQPKGVFSHAVNLVVDDTESLWNKPALPEWDDEGKDRGKTKTYPDPGDEDVLPSNPNDSRPGSGSATAEEGPKARKRKKVHLVVLTHGLHSNLGSDLLYLKESIDAAAKEARESARKRKAEARKQKESKASSDDKQQSKKTDIQPQSGKLNSSPASPSDGRDDFNPAKVSAPTTEEESSSKAEGQAKLDEPESSTAPLSGGQDDLDATAEVDEDEEEEEEVIVRGFAGNVIRTERGIQYLGKRLAKWILAMTYPDQPYKPEKKGSIPKKLSRVFTGDKQTNLEEGPSAHNNSSIHRPAKESFDLAYKITSISFISHSLGGLTQTYAIAYIHKHSPNFFNEIRPINFVAMAAPFLGLSNENPFYVKFALDFGLVGRTGQDLGLSWRAPTMIRSGWGAMFGGIGTDAAKRAQSHPDPGSKPLLRILPTGHTHHVLKLFRNRTVYSNVVNDGIVPLRTSCLLFLDWSGLDRVEKARRDNGVIGTMAGWGWSEINGVNKSSNRHLVAEQDSEVWSHSDMSGDERRAEVPQPEENAVRDDTTMEGRESRKDQSDHDEQGKPSVDENNAATKANDAPPQQPANPLAGLLSFLRPAPPKQPKSRQTSPKQTKIYKRSQTTKGDGEDMTSMASASSSRTPSPGGRPGAVRGDSILEDPNNGFAPPKTTIFEAAGDVLNPPMPTRDFLINPQGRPRTIFHDRVYHPGDIPPPPTKRQKPGLKRSFSSESRNGLVRADTIYDGQSIETPDMGGMKVEEKIARAYHHGLSWRKVLVRLEPDAHNNMIVRRMFSNAYGWPVVKHLVDTHFADTYAATTADTDESSEERANPMSQDVGEHGEEVDTSPRKDMKRTDSEIKEGKDSISQLTDVGDTSMSSSSTKRRNLTRKESAQWEDSLFDISDDEDEEMDPAVLRARGHITIPDAHPDDNHKPVETESPSQRGTSDAEIADFLTRSPPPASPEDERRKLTSPGGTTSVGLGKSVEESLRSAGRARRRTLERQASDSRDGSGNGKLADAVTRIRIEDGQ